MDADQALKVNVKIEGSFSDEWFLARIAKDGRPTIPKLTLKLLQESEEESLEGSVHEVTTRR